MGIRQTTPNSEVNRKIDEMAQRMKRVLVRNLEYVGEQCVNMARSLPSPPSSLYWDESVGEKKRIIPPHTQNYIDWTANLRSSIGYVVVMDGQIATSSDFAAVDGKKGHGEEGSKTGKEYAKEIAAKYPTGIALIVVAGMNYAAYVQRKGYDVTASAELLAEQLINQLKINAKVTHV